jgi:membrane-associated phospholipid phosphatase
MLPPRHPGYKGSRVRARIAVSCFVLACVHSEPAQAQTHTLRWDPAVDGTVTAGGAAIWIASELLKSTLAPRSCRWCEVDCLDARVRDELVWRSPGAADAASNVTFVLMPLLAIGWNALAAAHDGVPGNIGEDTLLVLEAGAVAGDLTQLTKLLVGRERPFVHTLAPEDKARTSHPADNNLSFFSGHASETFALASASGTIATMRGYRWAPVVWSVGGVVAAVTAYLRIAADKHWLTDVVVGAVVGAGVGFALPYVFHSVDDAAGPTTHARVRAAAAAAPLPAGVVLSW